MGKPKVKVKLKSENMIQCDKCSIWMFVEETCFKDYGEAEKSEEPYSCEICAKFEKFESIIESSAAYEEKSEADIKALEERIERGQEVQSKIRETNMDIQTARQQNPRMQFLNSYHRLRRTPASGIVDIHFSPEGSEVVAHQITERINIFLEEERYAPRRNQVRSNPYFAPPDECFHDWMPMPHRRTTRWQRPPPGRPAQRTNDGDTQDGTDPPQEKEPKQAPL